MRFNKNSPEFQLLVEQTNIQIEKGYHLQGVRTLDQHLKGLKKCVFAAKGPSLKDINSYTHDRHVATVNESCLLVDGMIDYAFFYDINTLLNSKPAWDRIRTFVMSAIIYGEEIDDEWVKIDDIKGLPLSRVVTFYDNQHPWDFNEIDKSLSQNKFINTDTSVMGLHFLVKCGYEDIYLIGHDGGTGYMTGTYGSAVNRNLDRFREIIQFVANRLNVKCNINIRFHESSNHHQS